MGELNHSYGETEAQLWGKQAQLWGLRPGALLTSNEGALLPRLFQQQDVLQQGCRGVPLQRHPQQAAGDGRGAEELPAQRSPGAQRGHGRPLGFRLWGQLGGCLGGGGEPAMGAAVSPHRTAEPPHGMPGHR